MTSDTSDHPQPSRRVGTYRLERKLGAGGMGEVWSAWDERLERRVALKQIRPRQAEDPEIRERFLREARAAARLSHPAIVQVHNLVEADGSDWIVMELVAGQTLRQLIDAAPLAPSRALLLAFELAGGLAVAHARGIVHRDLKSENVIVTPTGHVKILDFGLAKRMPLEEQLEGQDTALTVAGQLLGTPRAMSPEQVTGEDLDHRSDLFSLGILLYEMVTGVSPFLSSKTFETLQNVCLHRQTPVHELVPEVSRQLSNLIERLLEKDPGRRPQTAAEVELALKRLARALAEAPTGAAAALAKAAVGSEAETLVEPRGRPPGVRPLGVPLSADPPAGRPPVLYVDDEDDHLELFERTFEDYYDIHPARSAREALRILGCREIHLVISDQRMPGMTGVQLLEAIQAEHSDPVRIILTSYTDVDAIIKAVNAGRIYRFITKPWDARELKIVLDRALESYDLKIRNQRLLAELEERAVREQEIRRAFQRYVPAMVVDELLDAGSDDPFLGELRIVAVLYFEIQDLARLSSGTAPTRVVAFLNRYYNAMNRIVARHDGTIKDGKLAVFGAPVSSLNNAGNAVKAALEMLDAVTQLNRDEAPDLLGEEIRFGVGINLGEVVAGNIGSAQKMEYTVIGEPVNVAARIHALTGAEHGLILLSESVLDPARELVDVEALGAAELAGRAGATRVYRVVESKAGA